jgi:hypothetical protein
MGYEVNTVLVDGSPVNTGNSYTFTNVQEDHSIAVTFSSITSTTYTITATSGVNGTISPSGNVVVNEGSSQTFTFQPNMGYEVDSILVDGSYMGSDTTYTFIDVQENHSIHVTFTMITNVPSFDEETQVIIYPNPVNDYLTIVLPDNVDQAVFSLHDLQGKKMIYMVVRNQDTINVANLVSGIYVYNIHMYGKKIRIKSGKIIIE